MNNYHFLLLFLSITTLSCQRFSEGSAKKAELITRVVRPSVETDVFDVPNETDAADDPCIWYNASNSAKSLVLGTNKKGGLGVFTLKGEMVQYLPVGNVNNVDIRYGWEWEGDTVAIAAASNRTTKGVTFFTIDSLGQVKEASATPFVSKMKDEVYGFCLAKINQKFYAFVNSKAGEVEQLELTVASDKVEVKLVRSFDAGSQTEGMVVDDSAGILYLGVEEKGIYKYDLNSDKPTIGKLIGLSTAEKNKNIEYDIEGLTLFCTGADSGYLMASSQGNYSYAVFERSGSNAYVGSFRIVGDELVDSVEETDGIDVLNLNLGSEFPNGVFVAQDGYNKKEGKSVPQNFKLVAWEEIANSFQPKLMSAPTYTPTHLK